MKDGIFVSQTSPVLVIGFLLETRSAPATPRDPTMPKAARAGVAGLSWLRVSVADRDLFISRLPGRGSSSG
jgi:hypothetical protein